ncbi:MAG: SDR family oxidoreductase, partial [Candidatus Sulfotelmatobacter sp.]
MGLATAKMLLDGGARVLVTGLSKAGLESAQKELGKDALVVSSDARSLTDIDALASRVKAEFDIFDLLFVNAGFSIRAPLESITEAVYDEMFNLNAKGPLFAVQKLAPLINRGGAVVLTTSIANVKGMPGKATYGAAKAALRSFARVLAAELLPREIRVNAVTPGPIDTPILGKMFPDKDAAAHLEARYQSQRCGTQPSRPRPITVHARTTMLSNLPHSCCSVQQLLVRVIFPPGISDRSRPAQ